MPGDELVESLVATRGTALTRYAYLLCGNRQDAEDLVQDALVRTFTRHRAGLHLDLAESYVRTAVLRLYIDGWRRRGRWTQRLHLVATPEAADPVERGSDERTDVLAALRDLPRQQRAAVVLRYYEDLTVPEIADRLGVSSGAVKRYLNMALHRLEASLGPIDPATSPTEPVQEVRR